MFGVISYIGICSIAAAIVTFFYVVTRPIKLRDEIKSWRVFGIVVTVFLMLPYAWAEVLTRAVGDQMREAIHQVADGSDLKGDLRYFKVLTYNGTKARVVAVGLEKQSWGGTEKPVMAMTLVKKDNKWSPDTFRFVNSDTRNADGWTFPPYW